MEHKRKHLSQQSLESHGFKRRKYTNYKHIDDELFRNTPNAKAGRIIYMYLKNFMCHSSLEVIFNPNTNFIIGRNGSGKSAILTALTVGLGAKARSTNRGLNIKGFIKVGASSATIEIILSNTGLKAYQTEKFGAIIAIVRTFSETSNSYKLINETGQIVATGYRELDRLLNYLNIAVDNPICLLNQDIARTFLNANDPKKNYTIFMKATLLEYIKNTFEKVKDSLTKNIETYQEKDKQLENLKTEIKTLKKKVNLVRNVQSLETRLRELRNEIIWVQINAIEQEMNDKKTAVEQIEKEIEKFNDLINNNDTYVRELKRNRDQIIQKIAEIRIEEERNQEQLNGKKNRISEISQALIKKKRAKTSTQEMIQKKIDDRQNIEEEIKNNSKNRQERLCLAQELADKVAKLEEKKHTISQVIQTTENDLNQTKNALKLKQQEKRNLTTELSEVSGKAKQRQATLRSIKADENNSISVYGERMQRIVRTISAYKEQFKKEPKGPIGSYIKLKDKKWALAVEEFIGSGNLFSFCVDNLADAKLLNKIFDDVNGKSHKPAIITSKFYDKIHNYAPNKVQAPSGCVALIDALIINDPVIVNCLIDQWSVENVLLMPSNEIARNLMSMQVNVPKNCARGVTLTGDLFFPDPNYRSYASKNNRPKFLQVSTAEAIKMCEDELKQLKINESTIQTQYDTIQQDIYKLDSEMRSHEKNLANYEIHQSRVNREINNLKIEDIPAAPDLKILTEELQEISKILEVKEQSLKQVDEEITQIERQHQEVNTECSQLVKILRSLEERINPLMKEKYDLENKLKQVSTNAKYHTSKIEQLSGKLVSAKDVYQNKKRFLNEKLQDATTIGPRIETDRDLHTVTNELRETEKKINDSNDLVIDKELTLKRYDFAMKKFEDVSEALKIFNKCNSKMQKIVDVTARQYEMTYSKTIVCIRDLFSRVLKIRNFTGHLEIDTKEKTLTMYVNTGVVKGTGQTNILSGGEKSFSTVAFIHSLWQVMYYPFYVLDEFDVFMDKVNRRTVMDLLLMHAEEHPNMQFIFLTPQDISGYTEKGNLAIFRMADPERHSLSQK